jgi:hypothetical protein
MRNSMTAVYCITAEAMAKGFSTHEPLTLYDSLMFIINYCKTAKQA